MCIFSSFPLIDRVVVAKQMIKIHVLEIMSQITSCEIRTDDCQTEIAPATVLKKNYESAVSHLICIRSIWSRIQTLVNSKFSGRCCSDESEARYCTSTNNPIEFNLKVT